MAEGISIEVQNLQTLIEQVKQLGRTENNKSLKAGLRKGGNYLKGQLKSNLQAENVGTVTGNLKQSVSIKVKRNNRGVVVGFNNKGHHAHLVDLGHELVVGVKRIHTGKKTKAKPFREKTLANVPQAAKIATQGIYEMLKPYQ